MACHKLATCLFIMTIGVAAAVAQSSGETQIKKMSSREVVAFRRDLTEDLSRWRIRLNQYKDKLDPHYHGDTVLADSLPQMDSLINTVQNELNSFGSSYGVAVTDAVALSNSINTVASLLGQITIALTDTIHMPDVQVGSPALAAVALPWEKNVVEIQAELSPYSVRLQHHTLALAWEADRARVDGCESASKPATSK